MFLNLQKKAVSKAIPTIMNAEAKKVKSSNILATQPADDASVTCGYAIACDVSAALLACDEIVEHAS